MKYIYLHIDSDGEPFYVGKGDKYRVYSKHNRTKEWHDRTRNGFDSIILEEIVDGKESEREMYWIKRIGRISDGGKLINKTIGGPGVKGYYRDNNYKIISNNYSYEIRRWINNKNIYIKSYKYAEDAKSYLLSIGIDENKIDIIYKKNKLKEYDRT